PVPPRKQGGGHRRRTEQERPPRRRLMRSFKRTIATLAVLLLGLGAVAAQPEPQFTGSYTLDRSQSQFPKHEGRSQPDPQAQPARPDVRLVVEQHGATLKVTRIIAMGTRERSETTTYVADGTDQTHRGYRGETVTRAAFEGDRLVLTRLHTMKGEAGAPPQSPPRP